MENIPITDTLNSVETVADSLSNNGGLVTIASIAIVLCIVLLFVMILAFIYLYRKFVDSKNNIEVSTNSIINKMLEKVSDQIATSMNSQQQNNNNQNNEEHEEKDKDLVKLYLDINMVFKDASRTALDEIDANRIAIYIFHNGNSSPKGLPFFKMSCIHDVYKRKTGVHSKIQHHDMPLHIFSNIIECLYKNEQYYVSDVLKEINEKDNSSIKEFVDGSETKSLFMYGVRDNNDVLCGFIVAEFVDIKNFENNELFDRVKDVLEVMNGSIKYILTDKNFKHKFKAD